MNWIDCSDRMDQYVIKKDGTAVDNEYFMATHVPFRELEFIEFGDTDSKPINLTEEQIYDKYIVNKANKHQMIIVRGMNGTGKSHLICWLHNRFINDKDNYDRDKEKVIFLRRLGNTVRGAVQQMLDEGLVQDKELREKFTKFCDAAESQSESEFKTSIYSEYVKRVATDVSNSVYKQIACKNIAAFLYDSRVQEYLMRAGGPVDRCYQMITSGAKTMVTDSTETIFDKEDFAFPRNVANMIKKDAAEEVRNYYLYDLRDDEDAIAKLVSYLNHFTSGVMQSCANITSENARDLFVNLRKSLCKEGKNLTIFIEDFTSFSIVESELITALAVENGGEYSDLCRVTSVIGITDGYYDSFRDNFKDRVTKQIKVTEQSFGDDEFLLELAARYLNAIYCPRDAVKDWYDGNTENGSLPEPAYKPDIEWDFVEINKKQYTLYPFNKKSLISLYNKLKQKSPRYYLTYVIQHFFAHFADGMEYGDNWRFPEIPTYISAVTLQPPYADSVENTDFSDSDKQRLKVLFSIWGDETTEARENMVGGVREEFLASIGLGAFKGVEGGSSATPIKKPQAQVAGTEPVKPAQSQKEIALNRKKEDIESWFEEKKTLEYSSDYNKWVGSFVVQSIAWQDEGLPGDFVTQRLRNGSFVDIEDSKLDTNQNKAVVILKRDSEARTILMGLSLFDYYKNWEFENAPYYQMVLINWVEKNKQTFINNLFGDSVGEKEHPVITWCVAAEYIQGLINGISFEGMSEEQLLHQIMLENSSKNTLERTNKEWKDVLTYLTNQASMRGTVRNSLVSGSNTIMGIVGDTVSGKVQFYRTYELCNSLRHLESKGWDISGELTDYNPKAYENIRSYLQGLYAKVVAVVTSEKKLAKETIKSFEDLLGTDPSEEDYINVVKAISEFYTTCNMAHEVYTSALKERFERKTPKEQAKEAIGLYHLLKDNSKSKDNMKLLQIFAKAPREKLDDIISSLTQVETFALKLKDNHSKMLGGVDQIDPLILEGALEKLESLSNTIEEMEV